MNCPHCGHEINAAAMLGSLNKGTPKNYSKAELGRRKKRLAEVRARRWPKKEDPKAEGGHTVRAALEGN